MFYPMPNRPVLWRCPKCGEEYFERPNPWSHLHIPLFFIRRTPVCPKCKTKMIKVRLFY